MGCSLWGLKESDTTEAAEHMCTMCSQSVVTVKSGKVGDLLGRSMVKNPPYNARNVSSIPCRGIKIPHAMGQVSLQATTKTQCSQINK